jgi:hypothetical protein
MGSSQLFDFWQSEYCEKLNVFSLPNSSCYISANLYVTFIKLLGHQTSIIFFYGTKFHDVKFKRFDMGSSQLFDFWQSEYCEKLTCILVTKFRLLYLRQFIGHLHQTFRLIKPVSSSLMVPNFMMWNLNVAICDQVNFLIFGNLNIVKN